MASATASMDQGLTRMAPLRLGLHPTNSDTTSMLAGLCSGSAQPGGPCLHTTYSYGTRFMPSRVAVTTATSATV